MISVFVMGMFAVILVSVLICPLESVGSGREMLAGEQASHPYYSHYV
jgi:hypothetical protein